MLHELRLDRPDSPVEEELMHIGVQSENCSGCKLCQQICTIHHFKEINPKKAAITPSNTK